MALDSLTIYFGELKVNFCYDEQMIYTITPNPVLDLSGTINELVANEKNYVSHETRFAGGNGINVAQIAHTLGKKVLVSGFLGGAIGEELKHLLKVKKISEKFIPIKANTRINLTISNLRDHQQTRFSFPGPKILSNEKKLLVKSVKEIPAQSLVVFGGSLPQNVTPRDIAGLIRLLNKKKSVCVVDMPGKLLKDLIAAKPFFIKPNLTEFQALTGKKVKKIKDVLPLARQLLNDVPVICLSSVENGALLITKNHTWFGTIPKVKIYSSVGAGDSMVGAFVSKMVTGKGLQKEKLLLEIETHGEKFLQLALAAACATLTNPGMELGNKKSILKYLPQVKVREII